MDKLRFEEIRARCEKTVSELRELLPPQVDYAELVCAEAFAYGMHYVWDSPEPYAMEAAATLIGDLLAEVERLRREVERLTHERDEVGGITDDERYSEIRHIYENSRLVSDHFTAESVTAAYVNGLAALISLPRMVARKHRIQLERDAAVRDMKHLDNCEVCKNKIPLNACDCECDQCETDCPCRGCRNEDLFEWRGVCAENGGAE